MAVVGYLPLYPNPHYNHIIHMAGHWQGHVSIQVQLLVSVNSFWWKLQIYEAVCCIQIKALKMWNFYRYEAMKKPDWLPTEVTELFMSCWFGFSLAHGAAAIMIASKNTPNERWKCPMLFAFLIFLVFFYLWPFAYFFIIQPFVVGLTHIFHGIGQNSAI